MAVSLYDQPAQAQFINTYVPIDFNSIVQAGLARQGRYDANLSAFEQQIADASTLRAIPNSVDEQYVRNVASSMQELADEYAGRDYSNPEVIREIASKVRSSVDRRRLADIQSSYSGYENYNKMLAQLIAKGEGTPQALRQNFIDYDTYTSGVFSGIPESQLDWRASTRSFFDDLDYQSQGIVRLPGTNMAVQRHARTLPMLQQHALNNAAIWLQTPEGNQKVRELKAMGYEGSELDIAKTFLVEQAAEFIGSRDSAPFEFDGSGDSTDVVGPVDYSESLSLAGISDKSRKIRQNVVKYNDIVSERIEGDKIVDSKSGKEFKWYEKLGLGIALPLRKIGGTEEVARLFGDDFADKVERATVKEGDFPDTESGNQSKMLHTALEERTKAYFGEDVYNNRSTKEQKELINDYLTEYQTTARNIPIKQIFNKQYAEALNSRYLAKDEKGNILAESMEWYDPENPITTIGTQGLDFKKVTEEYPLKRTASDDGYEYYITHELDGPFNPIFPAGYRVSISKDGKIEKTYYMSAAQQVKDPFTNWHNLYKALYANPTGLVDYSFPGSDYKVTGFMKADGVGELVLFKGDRRIGDLRTDKDYSPQVLINEIKNLIKFNE